MPRARPLHATPRRLHVPAVPLPGRSLSVRRLLLDALRRRRLPPSCARSLERSISMPAPARRCRRPLRRASSFWTTRAAAGFHVPAHAPLSVRGLVLSAPRRNALRTLQGAQPRFRRPALPPCTRLHRRSVQARFVAPHGRRPPPTAAFHCPVHGLPAAAAACTAALRTLHCAGL
ncbi:hypothetical protein GGX14DRAFT_561071 [Mycena pura]|uniref:Uncharacterized protein n=1 Tax=Mycena pura TaxID=153505 RepID=A0AAD6VMH9_9AGAR|nr:hypothetical protein GGX14DRAFT_561071 [Mycena pura]